MAKARVFDLETFISVGVHRRMKGPLTWVITPLAVAVAAYVIVAATVLIIEPWALTAIFLCAAMTIGFLSVGASPNSDPERPSPIDYALSITSLATGIYFAINAQEIVNRIALLNPLDTGDMVFGTAMLFLTLELTRRSTGLGLMLIVSIFVFYNLFGHLLGGVLHHGYIDYNHFIEILVYTTDGIMGLPARVAATYAFLFVLFGTFLFYAKGSDFFFDIAAWISGGRVGGPAKVAVISSGLYGMISGSPTADVMTTGAITIPVMKRLGYNSAVAAGIEVAASTGGSIMPPVMGSAAFLMAEYTGLEYREIAIAAFLPAVLYYVGVYSQVHFRAVRRNLGALDASQIPRLLPTLLKGGLFIIPLVVLTGALLYGYTPTMVAVMGAVAVLVVATLRRHTRLGLVAIWKALAETTYRMVPVTGATAAAGLVIAGITMTGLAAKFAHVVYAITNANEFLTLVVAGALCVVLGCGMPTPSAYILAAVLIGPLMHQVGIDLMAGHLFLLYFSVMSALTPPVAVAAYAASSIALDNPLKIAGHACKLAIAAFVVPFVFAYGPSLLWRGPVWATALNFVTAAIALIFIAAAVERFDRWCASWWARLGLAIAATMMITPTVWWTLGGIVLAGAVIGANRATQAGRQPLRPAA